MASKFKYTGIKPNRIITEGGDAIRYPYAIDAIVVPDGYTVDASVTNGSYDGAVAILEWGTASGTIAADEHYVLPSSIEVEGATYQYDAETGAISLSEPTGNVTITAVCLGEQYTITGSVTDGSMSGDSTIRYGATAEVTITPDEGHVLPASITVEGATAVYDAETGIAALSSPSGNVTVTAVCPAAVVIDPVLENNSWETIKAVFEAGEAANYWALGDQKNVTVGQYTRPVKIVHIGEIYGNKHGVFQFWYRTEADIVWDADNSNDVTTADIWASLASGGTAYDELVDAELGVQLVDTTVQVATSGTDATLATLTGKLFLPAEKEVTQTRTYSAQAEFDALTTFGYFAANDTNDARVRHKASAPEATSSQMWWLRSPNSGGSSGVCNVVSSGSLGYYSAYGTNNGVAPCFAF